MPPSRGPSRGASRSVPSSPTTKNPAKRTTFSAAPSPRKGSSCATCPPSAGGTPSLALRGSLSPPSTSPRAPGDGRPRLSFLPGPLQVSRPLALLALVVFFNYLGYTHPFLWSAQERAALVSLVSSSVPTLSPLDIPATPRGTRGRLLAEHSAPQDAEAHEEAAGAEATVDTTVHYSADPDNSSSSGSDTGGVPEGRGAEGAGGYTPSPYTNPWNVKVAQHPACRRVYPRHLVKPNQGPITYVGDLVRKRQRLLLSVPRHGLGNSLRGYVSSFIYAAVSGRRLVRFHGAEHAKVFDTLCHAFTCGLESISGDDHPGGAMGLYRELEMLNPVDLNSKFKTSEKVVSSFRATRGLFVSKSPHFFDGFWQNYPAVTRCVFAAFGCSSTWCMHTRAIQALLGHPTPLLESVIAQVLKVYRGEGQPDGAAQQRGSGEMFDIALHLRTRPAAIESKNPGAADAGGKALMRIGCGLEDSSVGGDASQYLKACLWDCLGGLIEKLDAKRADKSRPLQILLATDNEQLRPVFVERLAKWGTVYYSAGSIVHSSKSASEEAERLPTMVEFHLMSRSHTILEAGSYISTFAYFSGLLGNGTLAGISWRKDGTCGFRVVHKGQLPTKA